MRYAHQAYGDGIPVCLFKKYKYIYLYFLKMLDEDL
jgi:hypothetical protein